MTPQDSIDLAQQAIKTCLLVGGPILVLVMIIGMVVGLLQAVTQIQDQAVAIVPRILGLLLMISLMLPWTTERLTDFARTSFQTPVGFSPQRRAAIGNQKTEDSRDLETQSAPVRRVATLPANFNPRSRMPIHSSGTTTIPTLRPRPEFNFDSIPARREQPEMNTPFQLPTFRSIRSSSNTNKDG